VIIHIFMLCCSDFLLLCNVDIPVIFSYIYVVFFVVHLIYPVIYNVDLLVFVVILVDSL
jgi:hypothetical protein